MNIICQTNRIRLSLWKETDWELAYALWGNKEVMKYLSSNGFYNEEQIRVRLETEINNYKTHHVQYWKLYELSTAQFMGCCGLKPRKEEDSYELGFQLLPEFWGNGYAGESALHCIRYALEELHAKNIYAGHNPNNKASQKLLAKLGFEQIDIQFYEPTGLYHPFYKLRVS